MAERDDYMAYGTTVPNTTDSTAFPRLASNLYGFSGKEELNTTLSVPYLDFGARLYDPFTASWLSPDPLAADYPGLSPYAYCAWDPVNYYDYEGKIFQKVTQKDKGNIVIIATYEVKDKQSYESAQRATAFWNSRKDDKITIDNKDYFITYDLSVKWKSKLSNNSESNTYNVDVKEGFREGDSGYTIDHRDIHVRIDYAGENSSTGAHEIGHTLGMKHEKIGIMSVRQGPARTDAISNENITRMVQFGKEKKPSFIKRFIDFMYDIF